MNKSYVGEGKVKLIAGGGRIYTDIAARFVNSEKSLDEIIGSPYNKELVQKIVGSGHKSAVEFDYFLFGVEGYARVTEVQLVRKRIASYMIKTGRADKKGKRSYDVVIPKGIEGVEVNWEGRKYNTNDILALLEAWYNQGVEQGYKEENLRYLKPQGTEFKALIGMNAHALSDWFQVRCCMSAADEIRDMAWKMLRICKEVALDLFEDSGPSCRVLGYCPQNNSQHSFCVGRVTTKDRAIEILSKHK